MEEELKPNDPTPFKSVAASEKKNSENIYGEYQKENLEHSKEEPKQQEQDEAKDGEKNEVKEKDTKEEKEANEEKGENINLDNKDKKSKRVRRGKNEVGERNFRCPDCDKCYLSGPALTTHRKTKHGYGNNGEKRNRGRPKKEGGLNDNPITPLEKFNNFFNDEKRKPYSSENMEENEKENIIKIDIIDNFLQKIFNQCKSELFTDVENIQKYSFYELIMNNWDKENPFPEKECFSSNTKQGETSNKINSYNLDQLFFIYLKKFCNQTNKEYFWFMTKFIILFRECINKLRSDLVKKEDQTEKNKLFTQIYDAETVPEICNDFFVEFMEPKQFFGLYKEELIELIQHFCYWLFSQNYTQSHLTLLDS